MILSHRLKCIFIKPTKVAGSSFEIALSRFCGPEDVITPLYSHAFGDQDELLRASHGGRGPQHYLKPWITRSARDILEEIGHRRRRKHPLLPRRTFRFVDHMPAQKIKDRIGERIFDEYLKIAIVRDPFDYAISRYFFMLSQRKVSAERYPFGRFLTEMPERLVENRRIIEVDGENVIDCMIRFEDFEGGIRELSRQLGLGDDLWSAFGKVHAKDGRRLPDAKMELYRQTPYAIPLIELLCRKDIEEYGYTPPDLGHRGQAPA